jgi:hypothetical protein
MLPFYNIPSSHPPHLQNPQIFFKANDQQSSRNIRHQNQIKLEKRFSKKILHLRTLLRDIIIHPHFLGNQTRIGYRKSGKVRTDFSFNKNQRTPNNHQVTD